MYSLVAAGGEGRDGGAGEGEFGARVVEVARVGCEERRRGGGGAVQLGLVYTTNTAPHNAPNKRKGKQKYREIRVCKRKCPEASTLSDTK